MFAYAIAYYFPQYLWELLELLYLWLGSKRALT